MNAPLTCVIAGGPVDCDMGVDLLQSAGLPAFPLPAAADASAQNEFQMRPAGQRTAAAEQLLLQAKAQGAARVLVYCNSLSSSVDFPALSARLDLPVFTPLQVYGVWARQYTHLAVLTGNGKALAGIEQAVLDANPACTLSGASLLELVTAIEAGDDPEDIVPRLHLPDLLAFWQGIGVQGIILGCTHFPYVADELKKHTCLPLLDPAAALLELLKACPL